MPKTLISLVSDQTVQNVQFIKEKAPACDQFLFVSTKKMEAGKKTEHIVRAAQLPQDKVLPTLVVEEFSFESTEEGLRERVNLEDEYIVNITGGTKIMSLAVFEYFKSISTDCEIYYLTGQGDYLKLYPGRRKTFALTNHLTLSEYLEAYGVQVNNPQDVNFLCKPKPSVFAFFERALAFDQADKELPRAIQQLGNANSKKVNKFKKECQVSDQDKTWDFAKMAALDLEQLFGGPGGAVASDAEALALAWCKLLQGRLENWLDKIGFPLASTRRLTAKERAFLTGGWLEEWAYYQLEDYHPTLAGPYMGLNPKIAKVAEGKETEFDVVMVKQSNLKIIECKTSTKGPDGSNRLREYLDKLSARAKDIGLFASSYLLTMEDIPDREKKQLQEEYRIKILDKGILISPELRKKHLGDGF
jgi:hypothetical protein